MYSVIANFPRGLILAVLVIGAAAAAWYGMLRQGPQRIVRRSRRRRVLARRGRADRGLGLRASSNWSWSARPRSRRWPRPKAAVRPSMCRSPCAADPARPVLFFNPKSGGGKAERFKLADEARAAASSRSSSARRGTSRRSSAARSSAAPTRSRWPAATARRRSSPRSRPSTGSRTRASPPAPATTSRSTSASTATTSSARSTRSSTAASSASTSPRSTAASSSTTSRSACTRRPSSARATAKPSSARSSTRCPRRSGPTAKGSTCTGPGPAGSDAPAGAAILVSNNRYRLGRAVGSGTRPRIDDGLLGITVVGRARAAARAAAASAPVARMDGARSSRSDPTAGRRPASTARHCCSRPRCSSHPRRACCGSGSPATPGSLAFDAMPDSMLGTVRSVLAIATGRNRR